MTRKKGGHQQDTTMEGPLQVALPWFFTFPASPLETPSCLLLCPSTHQSGYGTNPADEAAEAPTSPGDLAVDVPPQPRPAYWVLRLWSVLPAPSSVICVCV